MKEPRKKVRLFLGTIAVCFVVFTSVGGLILGFGIPAATDPISADTYTPPHDPDTLLTVSVGSRTLIIGFEFSESTVYVAFMPDEEHSSGYNISGWDNCRYIRIPDDIFAAYVDNLNGTIYTDNSGNSYVLMGRDVLDLIYNEGENVPHAAADLLEKVLIGSRTDELEDGFVYLADNSETDISFAQWVIYKDELQSITRIVPVTSEEILSIKKKE